MRIVRVSRPLFRSLPGLQFKDGVTEVSKTRNIGIIAHIDAVGRETNGVSHM